MEKQIVELLEKNNALLHNILTFLIYKEAKNDHEVFNNSFPNDKKEFQKSVDDVFKNSMSIKNRILEITLEEYNRS